MAGEPTASCVGGVPPPDPREHLVAPLTLQAHRGSLYLRCRHAWPDGELKPDYTPMLLAVHRIVDVGATDKPFE